MSEIIKPLLLNETGESINEAIGTIADAIITATDKTEEIREFKEETRQSINTIDSRVSTAISSIENTSSADSVVTELHDIRVGTNGTTYNTAGDAVRSNYNELKSALNSVTEQSYNLYAGKVGSSTIASNGAVGNSSGNDLYYAPVEEGKTYSIRASSDRDNIRIGYFENEPAAGGVTYNSSRSSVANGTPVIAPITGWLAYNDDSDYATPQINEGSALLPYTSEKTAIDSTARAELDNLNGVEEGAIRENIETTVTTGAGKYVKKNGTVAENSALNMTDPIDLAPGFTISVKAAGASTPNGVAIISSVLNGIYTPLVLNSGGNVLDTYTYTAPSGMHIVISYLVSAGVNVNVTGNTVDSINLLEKSIESVDNSLASTPLEMFTDIVYCGDSLTYSAVFTDATHHRQAYVPWPTQIERLTGIPSLMQASSGMNPKTWYAQFGDSIAQSEEGNRLYITYFGHNASTQYPYTDTFDTDCPADADPSTWADTLTGWWGRIISDIYTTGCKALLIRVSDANGYRTEQDAIIQDIAERWNVPIIDNPYLADNIYHSATDSYANEAHYNDVGYMAFCRQLLTNIGKMSIEDLGHLKPNN